MFKRKNNEQASATKRKSSNITAKRKYNLTLLMLCLPGLACLIIFNYLPMFGTIMAFKKYVPIKGIFGSEWCGLDNFKFFFGSQDAVRTIRNTVFYGVEFLILELIAGVLIAVFLYYLRSRRALKVYHTIILLPRFMSIVIISFMTYSILSPTAGLANQIIALFGGEPVSWYTEVKYWPVILTVVNLWKSIGAGCLYYYAALTGIDPALFEAAELDGAGAIQKARYVMVPELVPIMIITTILGIGHLLTGDFGLFYQVPRDIGLLYEATDTINTYTYRALMGGDLARSAAVGLFQSVVGLVLVLGSNAIVKKISPENSMF